MTTVSVVVPWRGGDPDRVRAWAYVARWWHTRHPGWQVVVGACPPGPWCKAAAVDDALGRVTGRVLVVADADVVCDEVGEAVDQVASGRAAWAVPHDLVYRLTGEATAAVYAGAGLEPTLGGLARRPYRGVAGGGMVVVAADTYRRVPLDPRFRGWGQEDEAWGAALGCLAGPPWRGTGRLWHLWHTPQPRLNQHVGSRQGWELLVRYQYAARYGPQAMRQLLDEIKKGHDPR